nr:MAG TPA: hypothetical protein [Caudoviricetes sp.]
MQLFILNLLLNLYKLPSRLLIFNPKFFKFLCCILRHT